MKVQDVQFILDAMDEKALRHANNTACICYAMGQDINCSPIELEALWFAGLLQESGKLIINNKLNKDIDISFEDTFDIINKKEKLDNYTLYTCALLKSLESYEDRIDFSFSSGIIDQSEENVDGSGKPRGLGQDTIDTLGKVLHISAYYDSCRLDGLSHDAACKKIRAAANKMFPSKIINPFIQMIVKNNLHKEYCSDKNFTIGALLDKDKFDADEDNTNTAKPKTKTRTRKSKAAVSAEMAEKTETADKVETNKTEDKEKATEVSKDTSSSETVIE